MTTSATAPRRPKDGSGALTPLAFLIPGLALYAVFALYPTASVIQYSFHTWDGISPEMAWTGLDNYTRLFSDPIFWQAFHNTAWWSAIVVAINVGLGVAMAALLARLTWGRTVLQTLIMIPIVLAPVAVAVIWRWMFQPTGAINEGLRLFGMGFLARPWLGVPDLTLTALAIAHSWSTIGLSVMIFMAGLQAIDEDLYDAARVDGATPLQSFRHVTLPALRPITAVVFILTLTSAFKAFDLIWATTQGGPVRSSEILSTYMYKRGALENQYGYGSAIGVALLVIVTAATAVYLLMQDRKEAS